MKKSITLTLIAATALASVTTFALAKNSGEGRDGKRGHGSKIERLIEKFDTNSDNGISLDEIVAAQTKKFNEIDADANGSLTEAEFEKMAELRKAKRAENKDKDDEQQANGVQNEDKKERKKGKRGGKKGGKRGASFERLDADNDGAVTLTEFTSRSDKMFERMDRNDDGIINADDVKRKRS